MADTLRATVLVDELDARGLKAGPTPFALEDWVRFAKSARSLTASALATSEGAHLVRHRSRR
jgi:hypothetical protein